MDFENMTNEQITAALTEAREKAASLFALTDPSIEQVNEAEALVASIGEIEAEQTSRAAAVQDAADRFAAARATFSADAEGEGDDEDDEDETPAEDAPADEAGEDEGEDEGDEAGDEGEGEAVTTASARNAQRVPVSTARKVGKKIKRPEVKASSPVTITASADVPGFGLGQALDDMEQVTKALMNRVKGFAPYNKRAAQAANSASSGQPVLHKFGVASFGLDFPEALVASKGNDHAAVKNAFKAREGSAKDDTLTAAGWCAPSEPVYSFIADYVVDGLVAVPEVSAPRGGLLLTTGPARSSQGTALTDFGFVQTEAQAEAGQEKTCETIVCPDFEDHRLDAIGYCYKIPLLTQKAYPELITDALRFANVLYAHKVNARVISDMVSLSGAITTAGLGATFTDTLEALAVIATRRRRKWNVGENAVMEVVLPVIAREVFRADMSRRTGLALSDVATDQKIDAEFAARRLAVQYVADWQEQPVDAQAGTLPENITAMIFPQGTFIKAVEDVISLQAVYDAASLSINEYTGVFFEQGIMVAKAGYGSDLVTIPVCTAGLSGAASLSCGSL